MIFQNLFIDGDILINNLLAYLILRYDIKIPPKYLVDYYMDDEEKNKQENLCWEQYIASGEYSYSDFFSDDEDEAKEQSIEKQISFANLFCDKCDKETLTLIKSEGQKVYMSKCPKCKKTHKTVVNGEE